MGNKMTGGKIGLFVVICSIGWQIMQPKGAQYYK
jgi:hypothetical protein